MTSKTVKKYFAALLVISAFALPLFFRGVTVHASSFDDINKPSVFLKQKPGDQQCTLVSVTMMLRRAAILNNDPDWEDITVSNVKPYAWNNLLYFSFSYRGYSVSHGYVGNISNRKDFFISLLKEHPEGIEIYDIGTPHAVLLTDYTDGRFYCADPASGIAAGRIPLSQAYRVTIENADAYWYVSSPVKALGSTSALLKKPTPSYTPDPEQYKVSYSRKLALVSGSFTIGYDVKYVQVCLSYLGYGIDIDGKYGPITESVVRRFQRDYGLTADGICGQATWTALEKAIADNPDPAKPISVTVSSDQYYPYSGEVVNMTAKASGKDLKYEWYFKKKGETNWTLWAKHTEATASSAANDTWNSIQFYCKVTDSAGRTGESNKVTLYVAPKPCITAQPFDVITRDGNETAFSVRAQGKGLKYQWYCKKKDASEWSIWNGHDTATTSATANATWDGMKVYCKITDFRGKVLNSNAATVSLRLPLTITSQPKNQTVASGNSMTVSLRASGDGLKYQWYFRKKDQSSFSLWIGRTGHTETVTPNESWDGIQLYCLIKDQYGSSVKSNVITVSVTTPKIVTQPTNQTIAKDEELRVSLKATGTGLKYQWYFKKADQTSYSQWIGRTGPTETVTPNESWDGIRLYCMITDAAGNSVRSDIITVSIR